VSPTGFGRLSNPSGITPSKAGGGFGRLIYPGTGGPPGLVRNGAAGAVIFNGAVPNAGHPVHERTAFVPYPVFGGLTYGDYGYDAPPVAGSPGAAGYYDQNGYAYEGGQQSPVVIINQNFQPERANPVIHDYTNTPLPPPSDQALQNSGKPVVNGASQTIYLIAMADHTIYPAVAYTVIGDTLDYTTPQGVRNQVSLDLVDRPFSSQINNERGIDFSLPAPKKQ
jgi:hypothetical protein